LSDQAAELAVIKQLLASNCPQPDMTIDIAVNERGIWTLICYREELQRLPAEDSARFMRWLWHTGKDAEDLAIPCRIARQ
jgi:hypothetical protein